MSPQQDAESILDAAEELFYEQGFQSVGMDALRNSSGVPLKRIYAQFPGKEAIAVAMLDRRDGRWMGSLAEHVERESDPHERVFAVFTWLSGWLDSAGHRGCAWINAYGELGGTSAEVADAVRRHKNRLRDYVGGLVAEAGAPDAADSIFLLIEGCMVAAGISGDAPAVAEKACAAAKHLMATESMETES